MRLWRLRNEGEVKPKLKLVSGRPVRRRSGTRSPNRPAGRQRLARATRAGIHGAAAAAAIPRVLTGRSPRRSVGRCAGRYDSSEDRRVGKDLVRLLISLCSPYFLKKK